jgi:phosphoglycerate dehydrogenase-like enzyme
LYKLKAHYYRDVKATLEDALQNRLGEEYRISVGKEIPNDVDVLILGYPTAEKLKISPKLKYLIIPFAGIPDPSRELMLNYPEIKVFNLHHNSRVVAENVMAFLQAGIKHIIKADREFRTNDWTIRYKDNPSTLLYKKRVLICGYGHIGKLVESFLLPYEVSVVKIKRKDINPQVGIFSLNDLNKIVGDYDIVINLLPATPETIDVFTQETFDNMKASCYFINVGRGNTVVEEALFNALKERKISGAALDVWYNYPVHEADWTKTPPANYPFYTLDNVIISPHRAGGLGMEENETFRIEEITKLLQEFVANPDLPGIDLEIGY